MTRADSLTFGIAIPAYRNVESVRGALNSIVRYAPELVQQTVVVDDSGDGRVAGAVRPEFPNVRWIVHEMNLGFAAAANRAVLECRSDISILLNDDARLLSHIVEPLRQYFDAPDVFAVTLKSVHADGSTREGAKRLVWRFGIPRILHNPRDQRAPIAGQLTSDYAVGGHCAFRRSEFERLGGFDAVYSPFYWEDVDLSQRALNAEMKILYLPNCAVEHDGPSAIRTSHASDKIRAVVWRNRITFARRHARGIQRIFQPATLFWLRIQSSLTSDRALLQALKDAQSQSKHTEPKDSHHIT